MTIRVSCDRTITDASEKIKDVQELMHRRAGRSNELEKAKSDYAEVGEQLKNYNEVDIQRLETDRQQAEKDAISYAAQIVVCERDLKQLNIDWTEKQDELKHAEGLEEKVKILLKRLDLCRKSTAVLQTVYEEFANRKRSEIESVMKTVFDKLAVKQELSPYFQDIQLTKQYKLEIFDKYGMPAMHELSTGERQVLSLAFIAALCGVTKVEIPMVMDTPFANLFSSHRKNIWRELPQLVSQFILLVQDQEFSPIDKAEILPRIGREYSLEWSQGCTSIVKLS